jgi:hypothetical protein
MEKIGRRTRGDGRSLVFALNQILRCFCIASCSFLSSPCKRRSGEKEKVNQPDEKRNEGEKAHPLFLDLRVLSLKIFIDLLDRRHLLLQRLALIIDLLHLVVEVFDAVLVDFSKKRRG